MGDSMNEDIESLYEELEELSREIDVEAVLADIAEQSIIELKQPELYPIYDEYYGGKVFEDVMEKGGKKPRLKDPKGGLTAAGRAYFKRKEGANLKPGVRGAANTPEKMRRKGSFLTRFFTNPSGPMKDEKGRATRLALSAAAWGEPVPQNMDDARKLAEKGRRLLERYKNVKEKKSDIAALVINKSAFVGEEVEIESVDMKGLISPSFMSLAESFSCDQQELYSRHIAKRNLVALSPGHIKGDEWMMGDSGEMLRIKKASKYMADRRKKNNKKKRKVPASG